MNDLVSTLALFPTFVSLLGACILWLVPLPYPGHPLRRQLHLVTLVLVVLCFITLGVAGGPSLTVPVSIARGDFGGSQTSPDAPGAISVSLDTPLEWSFDGLALLFGLLLVVAFLSIDLSRASHDPSRLDAASSLVVVGVGTAVFGSANLVTLCLTWGLYDLALLGLQVVRATDRTATHAIRGAWANLLSTVLLSMAAVAQPIGEASTSVAPGSSQGIVTVLLMLAAWLRMGAYPLPGSYTRPWGMRLASLCAGALLWLRVAHQVSPFESQGISLGLVGGVLLLVPALRAALSSDLAAASPYLLHHGLTMMIVAPLLDQKAGLPIALLSAVHLGLYSTLSRTDEALRSVPLPKRWTRSPLIVALASTSGLPLTMGFAAHWLFLAASWLAGERWLFLAASLSYLLVSVPAWRELERILGTGPGVDEPPTRAVWPILAGGIVPGVLLAVFGLNPAWLESLWQGGFPGFDLPSTGELFQGGAALQGRLLALAVVIPLLGGYAYHRASANLSERFERASLSLSSLLGLDWVYLAIEDGLTPVRGLTLRGMVAVEEHLYLVWPLLWGAVIVLFLVER